MAAMRGYYIVHDYQADTMSFAVQKGSSKRDIQYNPQTTSDGGAGTTSDTSIPTTEVGSTFPTWATWVIVGASVVVVVVVVAVVVYCVNKKKKEEEGFVKKPKDKKKGNKKDDQYIETDIQL